MAEAAVFHRIENVEPGAVRVFLRAKDPTVLQHPGTKTAAIQAAENSNFGRCGLDRSLGLYRVLPDNTPCVTLDTIQQALALEKEKPGSVVWEAGFQLRSSDMRSATVRV